MTRTPGGKNDFLNRILEKRAIQHKSQKSARELLVRQDKIDKKELMNFVDIDTSNELPQVSPFDSQSSSPLDKDLTKMRRPSAQKLGTIIESDRGNEGGTIDDANNHQ